jgi:hypothetical protein
MEEKAIPTDIPAMKRPTQSITTSENTVSMSHEQVISVILSPTVH